MRPPSTLSLRAKLSVAGSTVAVHRGSHPAATAHAAGMRQSSPPPLWSKLWNEEALGLAFRSSTVAILDHLATVSGSISNARLNAAREGCDRYIAARTARVVVALCASVTCLPGMASFHSNERIGPSNHRIKRLKRGNGRAAMKWNHNKLNSPYHCKRAIRLPSNLSVS